MVHSLTDRDVAILREAVRVGRLVSIVRYPGGRLEDVASSGWDAGSVPLPSDVEVRALVRSGHLLEAERSAATSFYVADRGRQLVAAAEDASAAAAAAGASAHRPR